MDRSGPYIPLNLPIIQIIILHLSTPLFKRKLSIILKKKTDKMQMKHEYDQNVHVHFGQQVLDYMQFFVSSEAKELLALPKMIDD